MQVHQTKFLLDIGFSPNVAVWALGVVSLLGIPGQIWLGHLSDRIGREWVWAISCVGFAICFAALIALKYCPRLPLVYLMVFTQGALGYGLTSVMGPVVLEIFQGKHYGSIFGTIMLAALAGGAAGPWATGVLHDLSGNYTVAFAIGIAMSVLSALAIWQASPGKVRAVAGQLHKAQAGAGVAASVRTGLDEMPDRFLQIADGAQKTVGRRGLRIDQAVQAKAVLQRQKDRAGPCRVQSRVPAAVLRGGLDDVGDQLAAARAAAWRVRAGAFRRAPRTGSSPCAEAENGRADPAGCGPWSSARR